MFYSALISPGRAQILDGRARPMGPAHGAGSDPNPHLNEQKA